MLIINQDRDRHVVLRHDGTQALFALPAFSNKRLLGFNMFLDYMLLGTFDSMKETLDEMTQLLMYTDPVYYVSDGCDEWDTM